MGTKIENRLAVRYRKGAEGKLSLLLNRWGDVTEIKSRQLFIIDLPDSNSRKAIIEQLQQWKEEGLIEDIAPVVDDPTSKSPRILTDEITVRFKSEVSEQDLKDFSQKFGVSIIRQNEFISRQFIVKVKNDDPTEPLAIEIANRMAQSDNVEFASPIYISQYRR